MPDPDLIEVTETLHLENDVRSLLVRIDERWSVSFHVKLSEVSIYVDNTTDESYFLYWINTEFVVTDAWRDAVINEIIHILFYQPYNMDADHALNLIRNLLPMEG